MKILLATFWIVPHVGGVWNYMTQLRDRLVTLGHEVELLGFGEGHDYVHNVTQRRKIHKKDVNPFEETLPNELPLRLHRDPIVNYYVKLFKLYKAALRPFSMEDYDLIHTQDVFSTYCISQIRPRHTALISTIHGSVARELKYAVTNVYKLPTAKSACSYFDELEFRGATAADYTIVANEWLKAILINEHQVPREQLIVRHYGFDTVGFLKRSEESSLIKRPEGKKVILFTGRLVELKGVHHLISALHQLKQKRSDWECWIVGDGDQKTDLEQMVRSFGMDTDVHFLGKRDDIPSLLAVSDIFVLPSRIDNQPLSVIEAQIAGKAVIVSDAGGLPEMVEHGMTGIITPSGDPTMLSIHIEYLLEHDQYRANLGTRAKTFALEHWAMDTAIDHVLDIYQSAISKRKSF